MILFVWICIEILPNDRKNKITIALVVILDIIGDENIPWVRSNRPFKIT